MSKLRDSTALREGFVVDLVVGTTVFLGPYLLVWSLLAENHPTNTLAKLSSLALLVPYLLTLLWLLWGEIRTTRSDIMGRCFALVYVTGWVLFAAGTILCTLRWAGSIDWQWYVVLSPIIFQTIAIAVLMGVHYLRRK